MKVEGFRRGERFRRLITVVPATDLTGDIEIGIFLFESLTELNGLAVKVDSNVLFSASDFINPPAR